MRLSDVLEEIGYDCPKKYENIEFTEIVTDSRLVTQGCMFICRRGHNRDGHDYAEDAINNGAAVVVAEQVRDWCVGGAAIIKVDNTDRLAAMLYDRQCGYPTKKLKITGVTGTNGKTSVCCALSLILREAGCRVGMIGTLGCFIDGQKTDIEGKCLTTPDTSTLYGIFARMVEEGVTHVVMEVSSHALSFGRTDAIGFEYGVFTNLTRDHLDFHGDMESYFAAKAKLFSQTRRGVINFDDPYGKRLFEKYGGLLRTSRECGEFVASDIRCDCEGCEYSLSHNGNKYLLKTGALGDFSVTNTQLAAAVALDMGISPMTVARGLIRFSGAEGRMERYAGGDIPFEVFIDYAHTPDALERALRTLKAIKPPQARLILLFGCGGERDIGKRRQMAAIASRFADFVIITSDNPRSEDPMRIIGDILKGIDKEKPYEVIAPRRQAIKYALDIAAAGDVVLLAGKGHERYEIDASGYHPFDERNILEEIIKG